ncbi:ACP phosphodiesterase [Mesonia sp. HuA40]|uniref:acyl carrier protein phosphodiesterase n=1 Tax=Mesonia sp. HuA40 TaxID=2602761 RepID=UPI0011CB2C40|nr:ACP phosphodiesterase [Mesonia sp. HuA40]TXK71112.1 DUF479 domain-containing protein [Mesonia sp. HuA40]
MNYLAHIYLSQARPMVALGNFMADSVKGNDYQNYSTAIKKGILLHRSIDSFTDSHPVVYQSAHRFFNKFRHYNKVINDVLYDHFLAVNWAEYSIVNLDDFIENFYILLDQHKSVLPQKVNQFYPIMIKQNWLKSYQSISGITQILDQMSRRIPTKAPLSEAVPIMQNHYLPMQNEFKIFFTDLIQHSQEKLALLDKEYPEGINEKFY